MKATALSVSAIVVDGTEPATIPQKMQAGSALTTSRVLAALFNMVLVDERRMPAMAHGASEITGAE